MVAAGRCSTRDNLLGDNVLSAYDGKSIGINQGTAFGNSDLQVGGLDYSFLFLDSSPEVKINPYVTGPTSDDGTISELYPVTSYLTPTETGLEVCAYGAKSGYQCGELVEIDVKVSISNPWASGTKLVKGLNEVDMGENGFEHDEDLGGPVYFVSDNGKHKTAQALGHIVAIINDDPKNKLLYYMPIEKISNPGTNFTLTLLTYTEKENADSTNETEIKYSEGNEFQTESIDYKNYLMAGYPLGIKKPINLGGFGCTSNFVVSAGDVSKGILTTGHGIDVNSEIYFGEKKVGIAQSANWGGDNGHDYAFVNAYTWNDVVPIPCIALPPLEKGGEFRILAVRPVFVPIRGERVCGAGMINGLLCGTIQETNIAISFTTSLGGTKRLVIGLNSVVIEGNKKFGPGDSGGPIFVQNSDTTVQAVGYIVGASINKAQEVLYYMPIRKVLEAEKFVLMTAKSCSIRGGQKEQMTEKHEAQIEVPPKK